MSKHNTFCEERPGKPCVAEEHRKEGIYSCKYCGRILDRVLDEGAEWRNFDQDNRNRVTFVGANDHTENMYTQGTNKYSSSTDAATTRRLRAERLLKEFFDRLGLAEGQVEHGKQYFKTLESKHAAKIKGKKLEPLILGIVCRVSKEDNTGFSIRMLAERLGKKEKDIRKGDKDVNEILGNAISMDIEQSLNQYCNNVGIGNLAIQCSSIANIVRNILEGKQPGTICAVIMFFVCRYKRTLDQEMEKRIADECHVSVNNVRNILSQLNEKRDDLEKKLLASESQS